jgi:hypothetical protein
VALLFFFLFLDNLLRRVEGQGWKGFWPCSGRFEMVVLFGMLSLVAQFVYWSRIVSGLNLFPRTPFPTINVRPCEYPNIWPSVSDGCEFSLLFDKDSSARFP